MTQEPKQVAVIGADRMMVSYIADWCRTGQAEKAAEMIAKLRLTSQPAVADVEPQAFVYSHPKYDSDVGSVPLTEADKAAGWTERPLYASTPQSETEKLREALRPFAALADEWDRWQAKGSTSTPAMVGFGYGRCQIGLTDYQAARAALAEARS